MTNMKTPGGRTFVVLGDASLITMERLPVLERRLDSDPRVASISIRGHRNPGAEFLRAAAPAGAAFLIATDVDEITGTGPHDANAELLTSWATRASDRGLWHDWWLCGSPDVVNAEELVVPSSVDVQESGDLASSRYSALRTARIDPKSISLVVDATWLGPYQTGAQVLTTAAVEALATNSRIAHLALVGIDALPDYASHLEQFDSISLGAAITEPADAVWYPNQIDQRVDISQARTMGRRVIATYLDLIAYDIPRYHASPEAWSAYRVLQRRVALSVDGITTISADVAARLMDEVPRLDAQRVQAIPLGLDHISGHSPGANDALPDLEKGLAGRPFILVLGNDFQHKNRDFAIRVWEGILEAGVNCDLVLAGLHVRSSSSKEAEDVLLDQHTNLRGSAHVLGHVSPEEREWLLTHAAAVIYPSSAEGFGFVPYEAAALGTPASFTAFGPLREIAGLSDVPATWSVADYTADLIGLLQDPEIAQQRVNQLREAIARSTWQGFADRLLDFIVTIDGLPPVEAALVGGTASDASALASVLSSRTWRATAPLRKMGRRLKR